MVMLNGKIVGAGADVLLGIGDAAGVRVEEGDRVAVFAGVNVDVGEVADAVIVAEGARAGVSVRGMDVAVGAEGGEATAQPTQTRSETTTTRARMPVWSIMIGQQGTDADMENPHVRCVGLFLDLGMPRTRIELVTPRFSAACSTY